MTRRQSRTTQRILERKLFGPEPRPLPRVKSGAGATVAAPPGIPGNCWACGNCCFLADERDVWDCPACGVTYTKAEPHGVREGW